MSLIGVFGYLGEKLSKQELQSNGIIKKLRLKERQNDQLLAAQRYARSMLTYGVMKMRMYSVTIQCVYCCVHGGRSTVCGCVCLLGTMRLCMMVKYVLCVCACVCVCVSRQQIEDLEDKVKAMKEQLKKKDENERKFQGKGYTGWPVCLRE